MISEEKELSFQDYLREHSTFSFSMISNELEDILATTQIRYLIKKYRNAGYLNYDNSSKEYNVLNKNFESDDTEKNEKEDDTIADTKLNKNVNDSVEEKEKPKEEKPEMSKKEVGQSKDTVPPLMKEKLKEIEKAQLNQKPKEPKQIILRKTDPVIEPPNEPVKKGTSKLTYVVIAIAVGCGAFILYKFFMNKTPTKEEKEPAPEKNELSDLGFVRAEDLL